MNERFRGCLTLPQILRRYFGCYVNVLLVRAQVFDFLMKT